MLLIVYIVSSFLKLLLFIIALADMAQNSPVSEIGIFGL